MCKQTFVDQMWNLFFYLQYSGSGHGPLRSSLKKPKQRDIASVSSRSSSKQVRISLGAEQTTVWRHPLEKNIIIKLSKLKDLNFFNLVCLDLVPYQNKQEKKKKKWAKKVF